MVIKVRDLTLKRRKHNKNKFYLICLGAGPHPSLYVDNHSVSSSQRGRRMERRRREGRWNLKRIGQQTFSEHP